MGIMTDIVLPLALAFIMLSLGLGLTFADFTRIIKMPKDFAVGVLCQLFLLPLVAFFLISVWELRPEIALGVMIIAAAPGGVTSNILTLFARGDVALSVSLTAVISLLSVISIPLIVGISYNHLIDKPNANSISVTGIAISIFLIVTIPVIAGVLLRKFADKFVATIERSTRFISAILFVLVLAGAIYQQRYNIVEYFAEAGAVTFALNIIMMIIAYLVASALSTKYKQKIAISIECGLQNGTLAIAVATLLMGSSPVMIPAATYSLIMFATSLIFICFLRFRTPKT
ncbi:MAG: symporter [Alphaproteobacteria bacterium]|jgi:BASS family bile acid:Na+ symporter|nr:symporter [Alphaproteobacteria bacterium]PPR12482.1 MAG: Pantothenate precursors transporter PanS [Alphaproteobacteria bacterium MarineAlpha12_Bin1]|tara:strand:+ start:12612 stop:13472 length:861 start_codon:yes stop_codon:yes gene_type:complete